MSTFLTECQVAASQCLSVLVNSKGAVNLKLLESKIDVELIFIQSLVRTIFKYLYGLKAC